MMEGPRHQHLHQEWQEPLEERILLMKSYRLAAKISTASRDVRRRRPTRLAGEESLRRRAARHVQPVATDEFPRVPPQGAW